MAGSRTFGVPTGGILFMSFPMFDTYAMRTEPLRGDTAYVVVTSAKAILAHIPHVRFGRINGQEVISYTRNFAIQILRALREHGFPESARHFIIYAQQNEHPVYEDLLDYMRGIFESRGLPTPTVRAYEFHEGDTASVLVNGWPGDGGRRIIVGNRLVFRF
ncbi:hypothetical protein AJ80_05180 [Polytolypa hystricis UAMH7299]|uniref:Uncharacterized protein n=1 Tax=Polytolypa hystricis (strain UAMH7299) TaxID=1447883 RepID=A0A2B7Y5M1_POLH7|nr:hypothetical protein AJ80_05180 [Polytolypa hystricis UAMH7299]